MVLSFGFFRLLKNEVVIEIVRAAAICGKLENLTGGSA
jgi:hypothetical protein